MGGISTSHSASLSNHKTSASKDFDLRNWRGLTDLLRVGRESIPDPRAYAEFRNLVLGYAQRGGDAELRRNIDTIVATFSQNKIKAEPTEKKLEVKQEVSVAKSEPVVQEHEKKDEKSELEKVATEVGATLPEVKVARPTVGITTNRRVQPRFDIAPKQTFIPKELSENQIPVLPKVPLIPAVQSVEARKDDENEDDIAVVSELIEVGEEKQSPKTQEEYKARITEIKHLVHEKVGNPVALMGAHNAHGKKYMTALLSALKATSAGSLTEMHEALEILENVTKALLEDAPESSPEVPKVTDVVVPKEVATVKEADVAVPVQSVKELVEEVVQEEKPVPPPVRYSAPRAVLDEVPEETEKPTPTTPQVFAEKHEPSIEVTEKPKEQPKPIILKEEGRIPLHKYSVSEMLASKSTHEPEHIVHEEKIFSQDEKPEEKRWKDDVAKEEVITTSVLGNETHHPRTKHVYKAISVTDPEEMKDVIGIDTQAVASEQTELYSPKITEALQQLLHEWTIFGGSGLFGIGPGGSEHPLYIKLSLLSMGELLAGRWEKPDPKLIKVIKQYVDAWRHEQGIAYTIDETFEHYLRRVVQKILKRQGGL